MPLAHFKLFFTKIVFVNNTAIFAVNFAKIAKFDAPICDLKVILLRFTRSKLFVFHTKIAVFTICASKIKKEGYRKIQHILKILD